ncbi:kinase-like domain-containing protein [Nemania sp. FL0916]|nr:kinase-like domain-containing protein [Nemania sp. FL0916]
MSGDATIPSIRSELQGNLFRGVDGFFMKYFEGKSWSSIVRDKTRGPESAKVISRLSTDLLSITRCEALREWLTSCSAQFHVQSIDTMDSSFAAGVYLESPDHLVIAGSTRVFGQFHPGKDAIVEEDDFDFERFCILARQVFKTQSARLFLHAFLVRGMTLELWVFDRSGAYSSGKLSLAQNPHLLAYALAGYSMMSDEECGINTFVRHPDAGSSSYVTFGEFSKLYLGPKAIATPDYLVGLGTTCYPASMSSTEEPCSVVKFSWRVDETPTELRLLKQARDRNVWGIIQLQGHQDLSSIADLRQGLSFPRPFVNRILSCIATTPLGCPLQKFTSIRELLEVLCDLTKALWSLYIDGRMIHRDIAIKNLVITSQQNADSPRGVLIDFDQALDIDNVRDVEPMVGSDGFMAIGILFRESHTYRHDLESLFYVFLWLAIGNDRRNDDALDILEGLPKSSSLREWCSMDFYSVGQRKAADMSPEGFLGILDQFSTEFAPLRGLATKLHGLIFPLRNVAAKKLYDNIADAFTQSALGYPPIEAAARIA